MIIQNELQLKIASSSFRDIALLMGYSKKNAWKASNRIGRVIEDKNVGLDAGAYDFKYSDSEFVSSLYSVLGMDAEIVSKEMKNIANEIFRRIKPSIFHGCLQIQIGLEPATNRL